MQQQEKVARMIEQLSELGYTMQDLADLVRQFEIICVFKGEQPKKQDPVKELNEEITELLKEVGMPMNFLGFKYTRQFIFLVLQEKDEDVQSLKMMKYYEKIAKHYDSTVPRVDRSIRQAMKKTFSDMSPDIMRKYFGNTVISKTGKPTNTVFIKTMIEYLKLHNS